MQTPEERQPSRDAAAKYTIKMGCTAAYDMEVMEGRDMHGFLGLYVNTWHKDALQYPASTKLCKQMRQLQP